MKKTFFIITFFIFLPLLFAQESTDNNIDPKTGFPIIEEKPFITFDEGLCCTWVNRTILQDNRSNFNFQDFLAGAYCTMSTVNMMPLNSMIRLAAYYPLVFTFNEVPQTTKSLFQGGVDLFAGINVNLNMWNYVRFRLSPGMHFLYQYTDRFNYCNLGLAGFASIELPLSLHWTLLLDGIASIDYGNFGSNSTIEPYDVVWQYQLEFGIRYSKKQANKYNYLKQVSQEN